MDDVERDEMLKTECVRAFKQATRDGQSCLTPEDYKVAVLELLGYKPSKYEVENVWAFGGVATPAGNYCEDVGLDIERFTSIMLKRLKERDKDELVREVYMALDVTQRGFLTEVECIAAFKQVLPSIKKEVVRGLFQEVDINGDGKLSYRDFELMMKSLSCSK